MISEEKPRYLIQRRDWRRNRNESGDPEESFDWLCWKTILEFHDVARATNVTNVLNDCVKVNETPSEFQCLDTVTKEVLDTKRVC